MFRHRLILSLGGNLGEVEATLAAALREAERLLGPLVRTSHIYRSEPWGSSGQPWFLNQVAEIDTAIAPLDCLHACQAIEDRHGRLRTVDRNAARTLDIDLLYYDERVMDIRELVLPHPRIAERRFVLVPLAECWAEFKHPPGGPTVAELLKRCVDPLGVEPL
jgi:2-amino-4-hydroxy-6-hydroxymethyldihydropteridine diphosphokinase